MKLSALLLSFSLFINCCIISSFGQSIKVLKGVTLIDGTGAGPKQNVNVVIKENIIEKVDHRNLNLDVEFMKGKMCSTENLAVEIWNELRSHLPPGVQLHSIKLYETPRIYVEYFGE